MNILLHMTIMVTLIYLADCTFFKRPKKKHGILGELEDVFHGIFRYAPEFYDTIPKVAHKFFGIKKHKHGHDDHYHHEDHYYDHPHDDHHPHHHGHHSHHDHHHEHGPDHHKCGVHHYGADPYGLAYHGAYPYHYDPNHFLHAYHDPNHLLHSFHHEAFGFHHEPLIGYNHVESHEHHGYGHEGGHLVH